MQTEAGAALAAPAQLSRGARTAGLEPGLEGEERTMNVLKNFLRAEDGQDLIEYTLLPAFIALAPASLFLSAGVSSPAGS